VRETETERESFASDSPILSQRDGLSEPLLLKVTNGKVISKS
jgi:hypothetical protein